MAEAMGIGIKNPRLSFVRSLFLVLSLFLLTACTSKLHNLKEGESLAETSNGLLVGSVEWRQGGRTFGSRPVFEIQNIDQRKLYLHEFGGSEFRIALPPGKYTIVHRCLLVVQR